MSSLPRDIELHLNMSVVSRSAGACVVARAAYNHRSKFFDERTGTTYNYRRRNADVTKFLTGFPGTSEQLWNEVERAESELAFKKNKAQTAYSFNIAIPRELPRNDAITSVVKLANWLRTTFNLVVDVVIHWDEKNPHAHFLFTQRAYDAKSRTWSRKKTRAFVARDGGDGLKQLRAQAAAIFNERLSLVSNSTVHHTSLASRGINRTATQHEGPRAHYVRERLGISTDIYRQNQAAITAAKPTKTAKAPMSTTAQKPTDAATQARDFWREQAKDFIDSIRQPKSSRELEPSDYREFHDREHGVISVAVCVDRNGEKHFAVMRNGETEPFLVSECAIPAPSTQSPTRAPKVAREL